MQVQKHQTSKRPKGGYLMEARAYLKYARISPRKVSIVLDLIRNKPANLAMAIIKNTPKAACEPLEKLLKSAIANAENNFNMDKNNLYVAECFVTAGPTLKRIRPRAQGRAFHIMKRTSHITLVLKEKE
jgi:large subunit ribosomal protein L22